MLNGLDLFSGIGGLSLALQPWVRTVCYVEIEPYCQRVLQARIADGQLDDAPIWDDVRSFDPVPWRGAVDIVSGGFPCQDISTAGRGAGLEGERSGLFREIVRIAGAIRPAFIFLENVAAIVAPGRGGWDVVGALAALGYDARWGVLSAYDVGAPHRRDRWWCLAHAGRGGVWDREQAGEFSAAQGADQGSGHQRQRLRPDAGHGGATLAHAAGDDGRLYPGRREEGSGAAEPVGHGEALAHGECRRRQSVGEREGRALHTDAGGAGPTAQPGSAGLSQREGRDADRAHPAAPGSGGRAGSADADSLDAGKRIQPRDGLAHLRGMRNGVVGTGAERVRVGALRGTRNDGDDQLPASRGDSSAGGDVWAAGGAWWAVEPELGRVADGVPARVDRLRGLGGAVVPACARESFARLLTGEGVMR